MSLLLLPLIPCGCDSPTLYNFTMTADDPDDRLDQKLRQRQREQDAAFERLYHHHTVASLASRYDFTPDMLDQHDYFQPPPSPHRRPTNLDFVDSSPKTKVPLFGLPEEQQQDDGTGKARYIRKSPSSGRPLAPKRISMDRAPSPATAYVSSNRSRPRSTSTPRRSPTTTTRSSPRGGPPRTSPVSSSSSHRSSSLRAASVPRAFAPPPAATASRRTSRASPTNASTTTTSSSKMQRKKQAAKAAAVAATTTNKKRDRTTATTRRTTTTSSRRGPVTNPNRTKNQKASSKPRPTASSHTIKPKKESVSDGTEQKQPQQPEEKQKQEEGGGGGGGDLLDSLLADSATSIEFLPEEAALLGLTTTNTTTTTTTTTTANPPPDTSANHDESVASLQELNNNGPEGRGSIETPFPVSVADYAAQFDKPDSAIVMPDKSIVARVPSRLASSSSTKSKQDDEDDDEASPQDEEAILAALAMSVEADEEEICFDDDDDDHDMEEDAGESQLAMELQAIEQQAMELQTSSGGEKGPTENENDDDDKKAMGLVTGGAVAAAAAAATLARPEQEQATADKATNGDREENVAETVTENTVTKNSSPPTETIDSEVKDMDSSKQEPALSQNTEEPQKDAVAAVATVSGSTDDDKKTDTETETEAPAPAVEQNKVSEVAMATTAAALLSTEDDDQTNDKAEEDVQQREALESEVKAETTTSTPVPDEIATDNKEDKEESPAPAVEQNKVSEVAMATTAAALLSTDDDDQTNDKAEEDVEQREAQKPEVKAETTTSTPVSDEIATDNKEDKEESSKTASGVVTTESPTRVETTKPTMMEQTKTPVTVPQDEGDVQANEEPQKDSNEVVDGAVAPLPVKSGDDEVAGREVKVGAENMAATTAQTTAPTSEELKQEDKNDDVVEDDTVPDGNKDSAYAEKIESTTKSEQTETADAMPSEVSKEEPDTQNKTERGAVARVALLSEADKVPETKQQETAVEKMESQSVTPPDTKTLVPLGPTTKTVATDRFATLHDPEQPVVAISMKKLPDATPKSSPQMGTDPTKVSSDQKEQMAQVEESGMTRYTLWAANHQIWNQAVSWEDKKNHDKDNTPEPPNSKVEGKTNTPVLLMNDKKEDTTATEQVSTKEEAAPQTSDRVGPIAGQGSSKDNKRTLEDPSSQEDASTELLAVASDHNVPFFLGDVEGHMSLEYLSHSFTGDPSESAQMDHPSPSPALPKDKEEKKDFSVNSVATAQSPKSPAVQALPTDVSDPLASSSKSSCSTVTTGRFAIYHNPAEPVVNVIPDKPSPPPSQQQYALGTDPLDVSSTLKSGMPELDESGVNRLALWAVSTRANSSNGSGTHS